MAPFTSSRRWSVAAIVLCVVAIFCTGDRGDPEVTYLKMYQEGREAYTKERWFEAIDFLEKAIEDWHWYRDELAQCRIKCNKVSVELLKRVALNGSLSYISLICPMNKTLSLCYTHRSFLMISRWTKT